MARTFLLQNVKSEPSQVPILYSLTHLSGEGQGNLRRCAIVFSAHNCGWFSMYKFLVNSWTLIASCYDPLRPRLRPRGSGRGKAARGYSLCMIYGLRQGHVPSLYPPCLLLPLFLSSLVQLSFGGLSGPTIDVLMQCNPCPLSPYPLPHLLSSWSLLPPLAFATLSQFCASLALKFTSRHANIKKQCRPNNSNNYEC